MRRNKRRSGRGRVVGSIIVLLALAAAGTWVFVGRGYLRLHQAQARSAEASQAAAGPLAVADAADPPARNAPVAARDQLAAHDEPLRPRIAASGAAPNVSHSALVDAADTKPGPAASPAPDAAGEASRGGALKPLVSPNSGSKQAVDGKNAPEQSAGSDGQSPTGSARIDAALKLLADGKLVVARHELNAMLSQDLARNEESEIRRQLARIADDSIFSRRVVPSDPLAGSYTICSGDRLVNISRDYKVPAEILMHINGIQDATRIRVDQKIKVLRGPFSVKISKSQFRMDVYLQDLYVRSYRVGLGADQGTPEGVWRVKERLQNPTYYPPASSDIKRIIPPNDPENPLGHYWIGLEGVSGDAVGHTGYGMHGTIEPESIGRAVSLGCVRMLNQDVEFLYRLMLPGESTVTVLP